MPIGKPGQPVQHPHQLVPDQLQPLPHEDHIGVIPHVTAGSPQVDDGHRLGALGPVGVDVGHHVVAQFPLLLGGKLVVDIGDVGLQLVNLLLGNGQAQLHFGPGQGDPQPPPGGKFLVRGKNILHFVAGIAGGQGTFIDSLIHVKRSSLSSGPVVLKLPRAEQNILFIIP